MSLRAGCYEIEAKDPFEVGKTRAVFLREGKYRAWTERGSAAHVFDVNKGLPYVLKYPTGIWKGVRADGDHWDEWICYCGVPAEHYSGGKIVPIRRQGFVYAVYIESGWYVFGFRWIKCDPENSNFPEDHLTRFDERLVP